MDNVRCNQFYTVQEIHKSCVYTPGRIIDSGVNLCTEKLSKLVDCWLLHNVNSSDSYIQDSKNMIQNIQMLNDKYCPFVPETELVTIDILSLYTNIPQKIFWCN